MTGDIIMEKYIIYVYVIYNGQRDYFSSLNVQCHINALLVWIYNTISWFCATIKCVGKTTCICNWDIAKYDKKHMHLMFVFSISILSSLTENLSFTWIPSDWIGLNILVYYMEMSVFKCERRIHCIFRNQKNQ